MGVLQSLYNFLESKPRVRSTLNVVKILSPTRWNIALEHALWCSNRLLTISFLVFWIVSIFCLKIKMLWIYLPSRCFVRNIGSTCRTWLHFSGRWWKSSRSSEATQWAGIYQSNERKPLLNKLHSHKMLSSSNIDIISKILMKTSYFYSFTSHSRTVVM